MKPSATPDLARKLDRITQSIALLGFMGLVVMALLTFYDGTARYFGLPRLSGFTDLGELMYPIVIASCFPAGLLRRKHIAVRLLGQSRGAHIKPWLEFFAGFVTLAFFVLIAWQFVIMTVDFDTAVRTTQTIELPIAPWWWVTTAIMALCVPVQIYVTGAWLRAALSGMPAALETLDTTETMDEPAL